VRTNSREFSWRTKWNRLKVQLQTGMCGSWGCSIAQQVHRMSFHFCNIIICQLDSTRLSSIWLSIYVHTCGIEHVAGWHVDKTWPSPLVFHPTLCLATPRKFGGLCPRSQGGMSKLLIRPFIRKASPPPLKQFGEPCSPGNTCLGNFNLSFFKLGTNCGITRH